jgi:IS5 family transposase
LNEALLAKAAEAKLLRCTRVRVDTMVVPANVAYPTDSGLLARAVRRIAATGRRIQAAGGAARNAAAREEAMAVVRRKNGELADPAEVAAGEADRLRANAKRPPQRASEGRPSWPEPVTGTPPPDGAGGRTVALVGSPAPGRLSRTKSPTARAESVVGGTMICGYVRGDR